MKWVLIFCFSYGVLVFYIYFIQSRLLFFPDQTPFHQCAGVAQSGGEVYEDTENGIRYYIVKSKNTSAKGWVIHFHGNGGRACERFLTLKNLLPLGYHLVLAEYPGYAQSSPLPLDDNQILKGASDLHMHIVQINSEELPIILFGESLGTAPATYLAYKNKKFVQALILQTPFTSITQLAQGHYPFLPIRWILRFPFPAEEWASKITTPVFVFHGTKDEIIPFKMGQEQFNKFSSKNKEFLEVSSAKHNDLLFVAGPELWKKIDAFLSLSTL